MTMPQTDQLVDDMMGLVRRMADRVLCKPRGAWEAEYAAVREIGYEAGLSSGFTDQAARYAGEQIEAATRSFVQMLLKGAYATGGHA